MKSLLGSVAILGAFLAAPGMAQELRFATVFDAEMVENWEPVLEAFAAAHPGMTVALETVAGSGAAMYPDTLRTAMASGDPPDVFFMWGGTIANPFIRASQVEPLNEVYAAKGWNDRFPPWIIDRLSQDGQIYGVPFHGQGMGFFYRKDIFEERGLSVPTTYAEMEAVCTALIADGIHCATTGGKFGWHVMRLVDWFIETSCGPEIHDGLNALTERWDQDCVVGAYQKLADWIANDWLVPDFLNVAPNDSRIAIYQGRAAMVLEGP
jgi:raffinose/stachyose/melibiose transport system substrate-binding protein